MDHHPSDHASVSNNALLLSFLILAAILWVFGDVLTALVGTLLIGAVYVSYYKSQDSHEHGH